MTTQQITTSDSDRQVRIAALNEEYQTAKAAYDTAYANWKRLVDAPEYRAAQEAFDAAYERWEELNEPIRAVGKVLDHLHAAQDFARARLYQARTV